MSSLSLLLSRFFLFDSLIYNVSHCGSPCLMFTCLESTQKHNNHAEFSDCNLMILMTMNDLSEHNQCVVFNKLRKCLMCAIKNSIKNFTFEKLRAEDR